MCPKFKNFAMPLIFLGALVLSIVAEPVLPGQIKSTLYAVSLTIKEILVFFLPIVIFALVTNSIARLGSRALKYIVIILPLICCSNFCNTMLSYLTFRTFLSGNWSLTSAAQSVEQLNPAFSLHLPTLVSNDIALISGVILGLLFGIVKRKEVGAIARCLEKISTLFFKCLIPIMPLFIVGTAIKLQHDGILTTILTRYLPVMATFAITAFGIVMLQLMVLSRMNFSKVAEYIRNLIPALIAAFGSASSVAAMPLSIKAAEKNVDESENADIIIPSTVNIHLVGDCFFIPMVALAVMVSFAKEMPDMGTYLLFALHFVLAKFAVAAVPGGGVLVMIPIMQKNLGLNAEMLGIVTAIYVLFDPIITTCNVAGNGSLAILFDRIVSKKRKTE